MDDTDLKELIDKLTHEEQEISYRRRLLHGRIDMLRTELVARLQKSEGRSVLEEVDVDRLANILAGKASPPSEALLEPRVLPGMRCPEPGGRQLLHEVRSVARP